MVSVVIFPRQRQEVESCKFLFGEMKAVSFKYIYKSENATLFLEKL